MRLSSLFLLFLVVPLLEIYLLIKIGGIIGALPTVAMVVLTSVVGSVLIRQQGFSTLQRARQGMQGGQLPAMEMLEGVGLLIAGALLLTPGFFTDAVGFLLLVPPLRRRLILNLLRNAVVVQSRPQGRGPRGGDSNTFEGEYWDDDDPRIR
ncbi:MAG: FxsA family protein [Gammaproteobacteria bacterium]|nr:FxsA family protein [Gammaproteobacteria bacterium]